MVNLVYISPITNRSITIRTGSTNTTETGAATKEGQHWWQQTGCPRKGPSSPAPLLSPPDHTIRPQETISPHPQRGRDSWSQHLLSPGLWIFKGVHKVVNSFWGNTCSQWEMTQYTTRQQGWEKQQSWPDTLFLENSSTIQTINLFWKSQQRGHIL